MNWYKIAQTNTHYDQTDPYFNAIKNNDINTLQNMIKKTARKNGYNYGPVYHAGRRDLVPREGIVFFSNEPRNKEFGPITTLAFLMMRHSYTNSSYDIEEVLNYMPENVINKLVSYYSDWDITNKEELKKIIEEEEKWQTTIFRKYIQEAGFDSVFTRDTFGGKIEYAVFKPNQIKLASLITYDNNNNPIPLKERFNPNNPNINY